MPSYHDLDIYSLAHELAVKIHTFSLRLPRFELHETGGQLRRASKSISANIVEGYGRRRYKAEFMRFLIYAQASCDETGEWLAYIRDLHDGLGAEAEAFLADIDRLGRKLNRFIQSVRSAHRSVK
ncbi:MAG: four helix bundle protein [bacterium]